MNYLTCWGRTCAAMMEARTIPQSFENDLKNQSPNKQYFLYPLAFNKKKCSIIIVALGLAAICVFALLIGIPMATTKNIIATLFMNNLNAFSRPNCELNAAPTQGNIIFKINNDIELEVMGNRRVRLMQNNSDISLKIGAARRLCSYIGRTVADGELNSCLSGPPIVGTSLNDVHSIAHCHKQGGVVYYLKNQVNDQTMVFRCERGEQHTFQTAWDQIQKYLYVIRS